MALVSGEIIDIYIVEITEITYDDVRIISKNTEKPYIFNTKEKAMKYAYERAKKYAIERNECANWSREYYKNKIKQDMLKPDFNENSSSNLYNKWAFQYMPYGQRKYDKMADVINSLETMSEIDDLQMSNKYIWTCYHSFESTHDPEYEIIIYEGKLDLNDENGNIIKY